MIKHYLIAFTRISRIKVIVRDFYLVLVVLGIFAAGLQLGFYLIIPAIVSLLILLYTFIINDCEDAEDDAKDPKKIERNPISARFITYNQGLWIARITAAVTVLLALFISGWLSFMIVTTGLLLGHFYSSKTLRFKSLPLIDFISHSYFLAGVHLLIYFSLALAVVTTGSWFIFIGVCIFSAGGDLYNEYRDYAVDRATNIKNTAHFIGKQLTVLIGHGFFILGAIFVAFGVLDKIGLIRL